MERYALRARRIAGAGVAPGGRVASRRLPVAPRTGAGRCFGVIALPCGAVRAYSPAEGRRRCGAARPSTQGGEMRLGFRRMTLLMGVLALVAAGCGEDTPPADGDALTPAGEEAVCATYDTSAGDLLAEICTKGEIRVSTDPAYPPQSELNAGDGHLRGLRHRRRDRDRRPPGREGRVGDPGLGGPHRRQLERSLGHERRLDDAGQRAAEGPQLHRAVFLRAGRRGRPRGLDRERRRDRPRRQEDRRVRGLHLPVLLGEEPRDLRATSSTS